MTAEFHNPSILNRDFLVSKGIVPDDWDVEESITTPPVSVVRYRNGIQLIVDQSRLNVSEVCTSSFQKEYRPHRLVDAYVDKLPHVPHRSLGLNCQVSMVQNKPKDWVTQRFLKTGNWLQGEPRVLAMVPKFTLDAGDAACHYTLSDGPIERHACGFLRSLSRAWYTLPSISSTA